MDRSRSLIVVVASPQASHDILCAGGLGVATKHSSLHTFENQADLLHLVCANRDCLGCRTQFLVPGLNGVCPGRQTGQIKAAILLCHRKIGMFENSNISSHPGMDVALNRDRDFFSRKRLFHPGTRKLSFIPLPVLAGIG